METEFGGEDMDGYREARAARYEQAGGRDRGQNFELEGFLHSVVAGRGSAEQRRVVKSGSVFCVFVVCLVSSVGSLMPLEYGLTINAITRQVNEDFPYQGGRHLIGPWNSFIAFPATMVTVQFEATRGGNGALKTRTKDGLELALQLSFQYTMDPTSLGKLYKLANLQYETLFVRNARDVLLKAAADYEASEYWTNREKIGKEMRTLLNKRLNGLFATCAGLQLLVIELPEEFETSIVQTQVQEQMVKTKQNEQHAQSIQADTTVWQAFFTRNVTVTRNSADALYKQATNIAEAEATQRLLKVEAQSMRIISQTLGLTAEQMIAYQQFVAYQTLKNASFIYGMGNTMLTLPAAR